VAKKKKEKTPKEVDPNAPPPAKQSAGVYTMLLIISFIALCVGCVLLYLEMERYNFEYRVPANLSVQAPPADHDPLTRQIA